MNGYTYESFEPGLWTVGHRDQAGAFHPDSDHKQQEDAAERVHWLNGGETASGSQLRELLAEILSDLKAKDVGRRVRGQMPSGWGADEYQVSLWAERAEKAGVKLS